MNQSLDDKDKELLRLLQEDSRYTVKELASRIDLTPSPTFDRQKRLERAGVIKGYVAVVDPQQVGNRLIALTNVRLKEQSRECAEAFMQAIDALDEVTECYNISGDYDFLLKIYLRDMEHYQRFVFEHLASIASIGSYNSIFAIKEVKCSHRVPVSVSVQ